ncbi:hypothetical protein L6R29_15475 [Myxococcota bacterium]|nr:hypothetical protein [Myxococcota bacterium]
METRARKVKGWLVCGWGVLLLWGCRSPSAQREGLEVVSPLVWNDAGGRFLDRLRLSQTVMEKIFRGGLKGNNKIRWTQEKKVRRGRYAGIFSLHLRFAHDIENGIAEEPKSRMYLVMKLKLLPLDKRERELLFREERSALYDSSISPPLGKIRRWSRELVVMGARSLDSFTRLDGASNAHLLELLVRGSALEQRQAAMLLGMRGERRAIPLLVGQLEGSEETKLLAMMGGLVRLKAEEAVVPLIRLAPRASSVFLQHLVSAVAVLGGRHAEGFLAMLSSAHQDRHIRESAREAFEALRMKRTSPEGPQIAVSPISRKGEPLR